MYKLEKKCLRYAKGLHIFENLERVNSLKTSPLLHCSISNLKAKKLAIEHFSEIVNPHEVTVTTGFSAGQINGEAQKHASLNQFKNK